MKPITLSPKNHDIEYDITGKTAKEMTQRLKWLGNNVIAQKMASQMVNTGARGV